MMTLFTSDRKAWKISQKDAVKKYGRIVDGVERLYLTASTKPTSSAELEVSVDHDNVSLLDRSGTLVVQWSLENLARRLEQKFPALMVVSVANEFRDEVEYFHYKSAVLYRSPTALEFKAGLESGDVKVDLRLHVKTSGKIRNHGTGFRILEKDLRKLFSTTSLQIP